MIAISNKARRPIGATEAAVNLGPAAQAGASLIAAGDFGSAFESSPSESAACRAWTRAAGARLAVIWDDSVWAAVAIGTGFAIRFCLSVIRTRAGQTRGARAKRGFVGFDSAQFGVVKAFRQGGDGVCGKKGLREDADGVFAIRQLFMDAGHQAPSAWAAPDFVGQVAGHKRASRERRALDAMG